MKTLLFANTAWYLYNFRLPLAEELRAQGHEVIFVSPADTYADKLEAAGFRWIEFPFSRKGRNPFKEVATVFRLVGVYKKERPDFAHHFTVKCVLYGSLAAKWAGVQRVINAITGLGYLFTGDTIIHRLLRPLILGLYKVSMRGTQVVFQNQDDLAQFKKLGLVSPNQIHLIRGSGVDLKKFQESPLPSGRPLVVLPARMLWDKGVGEFVAAARIIHAEGLNVRFLLAGSADDDNPAAVPLATLNAWQAEGVVEWAGWVEDMPAIYKTACIVCLPSYREGLPKTLIEAAASGRPMVAANVPGCRDVVIPGETGLLAHARDALSLVDCLRTLLSDRVLQQKFGENARRLVEKEFSLDRIIRETLEVYSKLQVDGKNT